MSHTTEDLNGSAEELKARYQQLKQEQPTPRTNWACQRAACWRPASAKTRLA